MNIFILGWDIVGLLQGSKGPLPRKLRKKSEKEFPGPSGSEKPAKCQKRVENEPRTRKKLEKKCNFRLFFELFRPRGREAPRTPFQTFFLSFLGRGLFDLCRRPILGGFWRVDFRLVILGMAYNIDLPLRTAIILPRKGCAHLEATTQRRGTAALYT